MRSDTQKRINIYMSRLPHIREKVGATGLALLIAGIVAVSATFAWVTLSRAPEVSGLATSMSANGSLEIALSNENGDLPDDFDVDESVGINDDVYVTNLTWGNLVNLSDDRYGMQYIQLRPAQLNSAALLTNPLWGAEYKSDGRIKQLNTDFAYARYDRDGNEFRTSNNTFGVRAIATYESVVSDATQAAQNEKIDAITNARTAVNQKYISIAAKFSAMGTMLSKYAQDKLDDDGTETDLAPYLDQVIACYEVQRESMELQKEAYVALANFQNYMYSQNTGASYSDTTWQQIYDNRTAYNAPDVGTVSSNGLISLVGLTAFINDYNKLVADIGYLNQYNENYKNSGAAYYWSSGGVSGHQISNIIDDLIKYGSMTVKKSDGSEKSVLSLSSNDTDLLSGEQNVYVYNGILKNFEQLAIDETSRISKGSNNKASCTINVKYKASIISIPISVDGVASTKADGTPTFAIAVAAATKDAKDKLVANDSVANDIYGMAVDFWVRTNAEETCLTLEGAVAMDEAGNIVSYDGVNRVWGRSEEAQTLPIGSTTQGGGSCYVYYADTPEDMMRSLDLLEAMRVAFADETGKLLAIAEMDTVNYFAANGRITVPLVLTTDTLTTYTFIDSLNQERQGKAVTTLYTDVPQRIEAIVYLDGTLLGNEDVLSDSQIDGQLNIQFGSSTQLKTIGNADLMDDVRTVSAYLTKSELDYDNAVTDDDLTTGVVVHVEGVEPASMTAFFVRAINSQQGSRERTFTMTKQQNGDWTADYMFSAPGDYYLRYVRVGGVDYPLLEPQKITVKGFALNSVTWGESSDSVMVRTSAASYTEPISVQFATNDLSRMPKTVTAQFVRHTSDGDTSVAVPLSYNPSGGRWVGRAVLYSSGEYTLKNLIYGVVERNSNNSGSTIKNYYRNLGEEFSKQLTLSLGLQVEVRNGHGALQEQYTAGSAYAKDVMVNIRDNAGNEIENLTGARLYYSNGGSATNTINTDLTWDEDEGCYRGVLPITRAGRYVFSSVSVDGDILTRCTDSPVYRITSPAPPTFNTDSIATFYGDNVQFAPLTNDAVLDGIIIDNSEAATVDAVVYNASARVEGKQSGYFHIRMDSGNIYNDGDSWVIKLPTYTTDIDDEGNINSGAVYTQEGTWRLVLLSVYDCYDMNADWREVTEENSNPIVWIGNDNESTAYASGAGLQADKKWNFDKLSTTVSCTYHVEMMPGTTAMGSADAPFMSHFAVSDIGMNVLLTDNANRVIPSTKVGDVSLTVEYVPDSSNDTYGYKVQSGAARTYTISLNDQDPDTGYRVVSGVNGNSDGDWQYVGRYNVKDLKVTLGSTILTYSAGDQFVGVPTGYTITTGGPSAENVTIPEENIIQRGTVLGKTGESVTGTFLQAHDPGVSAKISLITEDNSNTQYVIVDDVTMRFVMTYQDGKIAPNGGYSWGGTSPYENITINMTNNSGTYQTPKVSLLSGRYTTKLMVTVGSVETYKDLSDVNVYSKIPTVKISSVSPSPTEVINMNPDLTSEGNYLWDNVKDSVVSVQNYMSDYYASVYANASGDNTYENYDKAQKLLTKYTLPKVSMTLADFGSTYDSATVEIGNVTNTAKKNTFSFVGGSSGLVSVGALSQGTFTVSNGEEGCEAEDISISFDSYEPAGEQSFSSIIARKDGTDYSVSLTHEVVIREVNEAPPSIKFAKSPDGYTTPDNRTSNDGLSFTFTLPTDIGEVPGNVSVPIEGAEWNVSSTATKKICYYSVPAKPTTSSKTSSGCNATTTWTSTLEYTYYKFTKTTTTETITSGTNNYSIKLGLVKWKVGDQEYAPGETITVDSALTATPIIGELAETRTYLSSSTQTGTREHIVIESDGKVTQTATGTSTTSAADAESKVTGQENTKKPSGYEWADSSNKKNAIEPIDTYTDTVWQ